MIAAPVSSARSADQRVELGLGAHVEAARSARRAAGSVLPSTTHLANTTFCWLPPDSWRAGWSSACEAASTGSDSSRPRRVPRMRWCVIMPAAAQRGQHRRCGRSRCPAPSPCSLAVFRHQRHALRAIACAGACGDDRDGAGQQRPCRQNSAVAEQRAQEAGAARAVQAGQPDDLALAGTAGARARPAPAVRCSRRITSSASVSRAGEGCRTLRSSSA